MNRYLESLTHILNIENTEVGLKFLQQMTKRISKEFQLDCVLIARISSDKSTLTTDSIFIDEQFITNFSFQLNEMPCRAIFSEKKICVFTSDNETSLRFIDTDFKSYISTPIYSKKGEPIGSLVGLSRKSLSDTTELEMIYKIVSNRLSVEFERMTNEITQRQLHEKLESLIYERNHALNSISEKLHHKENLLEQRYQENLILIRLLCHDLVNPLSIISMCTEYLQEHIEENDPNTKIIDRIKRSCSNMNKIINTVRELQTLLSGKNKNNKSKISIDEIFEYTKSLFQEQLNDKSISLILEKDKNDACYIHIEKQSFINNVLTNLVSNAIKFSSPGSIVTIKVHENEHDIELTIKDQGIGMSEELMKYMFLFDKKANRSGTKGETGNGLGMPIVKLFLDLNNIKYKIESKEIELHPDDHGTNFYLFVPKAA